ncbi:MAG: hypothetical protein AAGH78_01255 [Cyanobacteria bacterium P01_H01_bin.58]
MENPVLVPLNSTVDLSNELALVSMFRRHNPIEFRYRLHHWLIGTGLRPSPEASTHDLLTAMDDDRLQALGRTLFKELTRGGLADA